MDIERNTREHVEEDFRYMMFDELIDRVHQGQITLEQAVSLYGIATEIVEDDM